MLSIQKETNDPVSGDANELKKPADDSIPPLLLLEPSVNETKEPDQIKVPEEVEQAQPKPCKRVLTKEELVSQLRLKQDVAIRFLKYKNDVESILKSKEARKMIRSLSTQVSLTKLGFSTRDSAAVFSERGCDTLFLNILQHIYDNKLSTVLKLIQAKTPFTNELVEKYAPDLELAKYIFNILLSCTNYSQRFSLGMIDKDAIELILKIISDPTMIEVAASDLKQAEQIMSSINYSIYKIVSHGIGSLHNMSNTIEKTRARWTKLDASKQLISLSEKFENKESIQLTFYLAIANMANDDELVYLPKIDKVVNSLCKIFAKFDAVFKETNNIRRVPLDVDEYSYEIIQISYKSYVWQLNEIIEAIYRLAINDTIKYTIYMDNKMGEYLRTVVYKGNETEIEYSLKLLWQLCFDERIAQHVREDEQLLEKIKEIKSTQGCSERLAKNCRGVMWQIKKKKHRGDRDRRNEDSNKPVEDVLTEEEKTSEPESTVDQQKPSQIMISYNRESRDLCLKVKSELESMGFKVWIDIESIHGSSLESMAEAIETSFCVLMCMTEKYKQSPNCRAEAEYTFQLGKPIIPLIMQANYKPDGWLGIILGSKIFIHFMKYDFEECMRRLNEELRSLSKQVIDKLPNGSKHPDKEAPVDTTKPTSTSIVNWSTEQVEKWFEEKDLSKIILDELRPCNGKLLKQLHSIMTSAPEFYYQAMSKSGLVSLREASIFTYELKELFKI